MKEKTVNRTKSPLSGFLGYLISTTVSIIAVIYLGYHFINGLGTELVTEHALQATENDIAEFDAYILKNETVIYASSAGEVGYAVSDGAKVRKGSEIASIYDSSGSEGASARSDIIALDREIDLLTQSNNIDGLAASDTSALDSRIESYYSTIRESAEQGNYNNLQKKRDELLLLLNKRQLVTGSVKSFDNEIETLNTQRENLTASLETVTESVTSPIAGTFYSVLDGYESIFTPGALKGINPDIFDQMLASSPESYPAEAIGKIATDFKWYILLETTKDELRYYNKGSNYSIIFPYNNDTKLEMKLSEVVAIDGTQRVLLAFSTGNAPEDFSYKRMQPVKVIKTSYTGYKVPVSASRLLDGKIGVYILVGSTVEFRYIDIIGEFDGYYIVAPRDVENDPEYYTKLGLYDNIIVSGKDLFVGKMIS